VAVWSPDVHHYRLARARRDPAFRWQLDLNNQSPVLRVSRAHRAPVQPDAVRSTPVLLGCQKWLTKYFTSSMPTPSSGLE
jgi:hypothetical protein